MRMTSSGLETVRHLFEVAAGIDSQIVGEAEILGQVKAAYAEAGTRGAVGPVLNRILQKSFQAAKWIRTHTTIGQGQISTATVAVDLATQIFGRLDRTRVLVIGAGDISEKTARALQSRGAGDIMVISRRSETAGELASRVGATAATMKELDTHLAESDIVVSSTSSNSTLLTAEQAERAMRHRAHRPLFLIDLALPRDIDPACASRDNIYLYNLDDLARMAEENLSQRRAEVRRCRTVLSERAERLWDTIKPDPHSDTGPATGVSLTSGR
jgi:glutamyl-tRNA reductase